MPRTARLTVPGLLTHVRCRFVDGRFRFDDDARRQYLLILHRVLVDSDWVLLSYALMSSHIHLGLIAGAASLQSWLHPLNTTVATWINARQRVRDPRTLGHVFGDRPGTNQMPLDRAFHLIAYHHNNPVHAGVVETARQSRWTSHLQYMGLDANRVPCLKVERGLELCSMDVATFDAEVQRASRGPSLVDGSPAAIVGIVGAHFELSVDEVAAGSRSRQAVSARRVALAMGSLWGHSSGRMASELRISRVAANKLLRTASEEATNLAKELAAHWRLAQ